MPATLSTAISTSVTKSVLSQLPTELATEFNLDSNDVEVFLKQWLHKQLSVKTTRKGTGTPRVSGYMLFCKEARPRILNETPDLTFGDVGKALGAEWRELSADEQQVWKTRAAESSPTAPTPATPAPATPAPAKTPKAKLSTKTGRKMAGKKAVRA